MHASNGVVALHVGAGSHASSLKDEYKKLMRKACKVAICVLNDGGNAVDAVSYATKVLEDSDLTNAAYGSSLTSDGSVECDAGIMDGLSLMHGACGSVSGIKNPIYLAKGILEAQKKVLPGGLIPPSFLAGPGAERWAKENEISVCNPDLLKTEKSEQIFVESMKYVNKLREQQSESRKLLNEEGLLSKGLLDTVGAVCVDRYGNIASTVSSGGLLLKTPGRVGQAAVYGSGCWAENNCDGSSLNVGTSTSGCGEHLVRTMFARLCAKAAVSTDTLGEGIVYAAQKDFVDSPFLRGIDLKMGGSIILRHSPANRNTDLFWLHSTRTMGVAYMEVGSSKAQALFSEVSPERVGKTFSLGCKSFFTQAEGSDAAAQDTS